MVCLRYGEGDGVGVLKETVDTYPRTPADKSVDICLNRERERERGSVGRSGRDCILRSHRVGVNR